MLPKAYQQLLFLLVASFMLAACGGSGSSPSDSNAVDRSSLLITSDTEAAFQQIVEDTFNAKPDDVKAGINVAISDGDIVWSFAMGKADENRVYTTDTPSVFYSMSKTVTSAIVFKQMEDGHYSLDSTVKDILEDHPDYDGFDKEKINVDATVAQLLDHTSGIQDYLSNLGGLVGLAFAETWKPADTIAIVPEAFKDVGTFQYSNANYVLLGMIVEHIGKDAFNNILAAEFFAPLGMDSAIVLPQDALPENIAQPYDDLEGVFQDPEFGNMMDAFPAYLTGLTRASWAAGGLAGTPLDVVKWGRALYDEDGAAVSDDIRAQLFASVSEDKDYGLGITLRKVPLSDDTTVDGFGHGGSGGGYITRFMHSPELDLTIAIMLNTNNLNENELYAPFNGEELVQLAFELFDVYATQ
ncbi:MAG: beta-lactamase family protein [Pseudomonadales bacterium]|nr:beta-lactamase family protein [Pseudomonadales bacterium]